MHVFSRLRGHDDDVGTLMRREPLPDRADGAVGDLGRMAAVAREARADRTERVLHRQCGEDFHFGPLAGRRRHDGDQNTQYGSEHRALSRHEHRWIGRYGLSGHPEDRYHAEQSKARPLSSHT